MKRLVLYILVMLVLCSSCERRIQYTGEITQPKLVMQAEAGEGDTIMKVYVSHSRFFLNESGSQSSDDYLVVDAVTEMQRGDQAWQTMAWSQTGKAFVLPIAPLQVGETIRLRVAHPDYPTITAEQKVVCKPFCQVLFVNGQTNTLSRFRAQRYVELPLVLQNYDVMDVNLGLSISCKYTLTSHFSDGTAPRTMTSGTTVIQSIDQLFASGENAYSSYSGYSSRYELFFAPGYNHATIATIRIPYAGSAQKIQTDEMTIDEMTISFNAHNTDSYLYRLSMYQAKGNRVGDDADLGAGIGGVIGQEEAVQIYSNVANGYGIFAACSRYCIILKDIKTIAY